MRDETRVPIDEIVIDAKGGIRVRPRIPTSESYEFIYRAAMGVRWQPDTQSLVPYEIMDKAPPWWYRQIVDAARSEYGQLLELRPDTKWTDVPLAVKAEIEANKDGHAV